MNIDIRKGEPDLSPTFYVVSKQLAMRILNSHDSRANAGVNEKVGKDNTEDVLIVLCIDCIVFSTGLCIDCIEH